MPLNRLMNRLPWKYRDLIFLLGGIGIVGHTFLNNMLLVRYRFLYFFAISCVFMGMMILGGMGTEIKPVRFHKFLSICWFGVGLLMLLSGIRNNMDYLPEAVLILAAYPVLFICWSNGDRVRIFRLLATLCRISGWMFAIASFLLAQIVPVRYAGIFFNTNATAYFLAVAFAGTVLHILYTPLSWKMAPDFLLTGILTALNYYTNSRTGTLGMICACAVGLGLYALTHSWKQTAKCLPKLAACAVAMSICASGLAYVFQLRIYLPLPYLDLTTGTFYYMAPPQKEEKPDQPTTIPGESEGTGEGTGESEPGTSDSTTPTFFDTHEFDDMNELKTGFGDKTLDQYSTGRLSIWKAYASNLNLSGHASTNIVYVDLLYRDIRSTHMTILQVAYESGILAGILYLLFNLGTGVLSILYALKHPKEPYAVMPVTFTVVFAILSLLGSCAVSFWYMATFYYYVVQFPIFSRLQEENR